MGSLSLGENSELSKATQEDIKEATERARRKLSDLILSLGEDPSGWTGNTILNDEYKLELILGGINKVGSLGNDPRVRAQATADFTQLGANLLLAELAAAKVGKVAKAAGGTADDLLPTRGGRGRRAVGEGVAEGVESVPRGASSFSRLEQSIIGEARGIIASRQFAEIRAGQAAGRSVEVQIGGTRILFEPGAPVSGMTMFGERGFVIGRNAFISEEELTKTILHETFRLRTSQVGASGVASQAAVTAETRAAEAFADRAFDALFR